MFQLKSKTMKDIYFVVRHPEIIFGKSKYLFIFSHMRSRSSLLSHILGSNPSICGYRELHKSYLNTMDLANMRIQLSRELSVNIDNKYLLDKILHNNCLIAPKIFKIAQPKVLFLLREPRGTIQSITHYMGYFRKKNKYQNPQEGLTYYCDRLACIKNYAQEMDCDSFFLDSDDIINNTDTVLAELSNWLQLEVPLEQNYQTFQKTGKAGHGDASPAIQAGTVQKTSQSSEIEVSEEIVKQGQMSYQSCKEAILRK
ncbi:hypothetical protein [Geitlerinema sp. PCC 9228]|jgi:hypothetical protein|uniref:hypothetical protein n=1 Tax=Geitlerinema sp. PCC 9228 TaxID=111611 RepID=UPI0008F9DB60|nr:hypothetical protein [Geitlerinema sp. PCC 9228]